MPSPLLAHWTLAPEVRFLNHGSFGAAPRAVLEAQSTWRARLEREPVRFLARDLQGHLDDARAALANFLAAAPRDLVFVPNATSGVNAVLRSLALAPGDELLVTDQGYNACNNAARFVAERAGAQVVTAELPFPLSSPDEVTAAVLARAGPSTRLAILDHVTSPTGLVLPLGPLIEGLRARGVLVLVDGAHAPGMLALDVPALNADYYSGNLHKWVCAPKGAGFLWARTELQAGLRPTVISHGANARLDGRSRFQVEFDWVGTIDPTAYLCVPTALATMGALYPGGWPELRRRNRELALEGRRRLCELLEIDAPAPDSMIGSLVSVPLPDAAGVDPARPGSAFDVDPEQAELFERHRIEVPIMPWPAPPRRLLRASAQAYLDLEDFDALCGALEQVLHP